MTVRGWAKVSTRRANEICVGAYQVQGVAGRPGRARGNASVSSEGCRCSGDRGRARRHRGAKVSKLRNYPLFSELPHRYPGSKVVRILKNLRSFGCERFAWPKLHIELANESCSFALQGVCGTRHQRHHKRADPRLG